ncbi:MAG: hypothetical protein Q4D13_07560 [Erysipelotrichaceae bacterium]|nr:hypothetical protein [Erysipelotrichaceae bacterium]
MKKSVRNFIIYWVCLFALFNLITFIFPTNVSGKNVLYLINAVAAATGNYEISGEINEFLYYMEINGVKDIVFNKYGGSFWPGYIFIIIILIAQLVITCYYLSADKKESKAVGIPLVTLGFIVVPVMMIVGIACMVIPDLPVWAGTVICAVILFIEVVLLLTVKSGQEAEYAANEAIMSATSKYRDVVKKAELLLSQNKDNKELKKIYDDIRYGDAKNNACLDEIEDVLNKLINKEDFEENLKVLEEYLLKRKI